MSKYTVKGIKTFRGMEGQGFNATLYRDGKKVGLVIDEGNGGSFLYEGMTKEEYKILKAQAVEMFPDMKFEQEDMLVARLVDAVLTERQYRKWCKTKTFFRVKGDAEGEWRNIRYEYGPKVEEYIVKKYGDKLEEILNKRFA